MALAGLALLAVAVTAAVFVPRRGAKQDARSILIAAAQAMEEAKSVHFAGHGSGPSKDTPSGMKMMSERFEIWAGSSKGYVRVVSPDGKLSGLTVLDADAREWWNYDAKDNAVYVADLTPIADRVGDAVAQVNQMLRSSLATPTPGEIKTLVGAAGFCDIKESVTSQTREGRKVLVVTVTATISSSPRKVTGRWVCEVDAETNRLLTMHQYAQAEGSPEELVQVVDLVEYDVPFPAAPTKLGLPEGTKTVQATATIEKSASLLRLVMTADGKRIGQMDIQPSKEQLRAQSER